MYQSSVSPGRWGLSAGAIPLPSRGGFEGLISVTHPHIYGGKMTCVYHSGHRDNNTDHVLHWLLWTYSDTSNLSDES